MHPLIKSILDTIGQSNMVPGFSSEIHSSEKALDIGMSYLRSEICMKSGCEKCTKAFNEMSLWLKDPNKKKELELCIAFAKSSPIIRFRAVCECWTRNQIEDAVLRGKIPESKEMPYRKVS